VWLLRIRQGTNHGPPTFAFRTPGVSFCMFRIKRQIAAVVLRSK
jgi:hypothetical protein